MGLLVIGGEQLMMLQLRPYPLSASLSSLKLAVEQYVQALCSQCDQNYQEHFLQDMVGFLTVVLDIGGCGGNVS